MGNLTGLLSSSMDWVSWTMDGVSWSSGGSSIAPPPLIGENIAFSCISLNKVKLTPLFYPLFCSSCTFWIRHWLIHAPWHGSTDPSNNGININIRPITLEHYYYQYRFIITFLKVDVEVFIVWDVVVPYGLVVTIPPSHGGGRGSIRCVGDIFIKNWR